MTELVHLKVEDALATITLDSPANRNALSRELVAELDGRLSMAGADPDVRVIVLAAAGPSFCAGADIGQASQGGMAEVTLRVIDLLSRIVDLPKPVVAKVHAPVRAGGIGLVGACDIVIASEEVTFAFPEVRLGLTPAVISLTTLPWMAPRAASRYYLTGESFGGREAVQIGLVTECVPTDDLEATVRDVVGALLAGSPQGLAESKRLVTARVRAGLAERGQQMADLSARLFASAEAQQLMRAFLSGHR